MSLVSTSNLSEFSRIFRAEAYAGVEYSYDEMAGRHGTMVGGNFGFIERVEEFVTGLTFAADWAWAVKQFTKHVSPDAYLFRVDSSGEDILAVTLYCRYPNEPDDEQFAKTMASARPFVWSGPLPSRVAAALSVPGPRGIALRVDRSRNHKVSLYYKVSAETTVLNKEILATFIEACGLPVDLTDRVSHDIHRLYPRGPVGILGIDSGSHETASGIKFNPANVTLKQVVEFLLRIGSARARVEELRRIAGSLRAQYVSYLGIKYGPSGFAGWRGYFSVQPSLLRLPLEARLVVERNPIPTLRLPHY